VCKNHTARFRVGILLGTWFGMGWTWPWRGLLHDVGKLYGRALWGERDEGLPDRTHTAYTAHFVQKEAELFRRAGLDPDWLAKTASRHHEGWRDRPQYQPQSPEEWCVALADTYASQEREEGGQGGSPPEVPLKPPFSQLRLQGKEGKGWRLPPRGGRGPRVGLAPGGPLPWRPAVPMGQQGHLRAAGKERLEGPALRSMDWAFPHQGGPPPEPGPRLSGGAFPGARRHPVRARCEPLRPPPPHGGHRPRPLAQPRWPALGGRAAAGREEVPPGGGGPGGHPGAHLPHLRGGDGGGGHRQAPEGQEPRGQPGGRDHGPGHPAKPGPHAPEPHPGGRGEVLPPPAQHRGGPRSPGGGPGGLGALGPQAGGKPCTQPGPPGL
jgi:hypothetical protein